LRFVFGETSPPSSCELEQDLPLLGTIVVNP
jgi:hypothetical protein